MTRLTLRRLLKNSSGQDLVEYALALGLAVTLSGFLLPEVGSKLGSMFQRVSTVLAVAAQSHDYYGVN